jgi:hypothetical protein
VSRPCGLIALLHEKLLRTSLIGEVRKLLNPITLSVSATCGWCSTCISVEQNVQNSQVGKRGSGSYEQGALLMTVRSMSRALDEAFVAGLLLAGNLDAAEAAVLDGIAALEPDAPCGDTLLELAAKSSIRRRDEFPERSEAVSILPLELKRLLLLAPICRDCFILQVLIGLTPATCSGILHLSQQECEDALQRAFQKLPFVETSDERVHSLQTSLALDLYEQVNAQ